jgi:hypothetical protein
MFAKRVIGLACIAMLFGFAAVSAAQSLADVARKEEARRKNVPEAGKVYTNKDLKPVPQTAPPAAAADAKPDEPKADDSKGADAKAADSKSDDKAAAKSSEKPADDKGPPAKAEPAKDQAYWSGRLKALQEQLARDEQYLAAMQSRINGLTADFINRDDPAQKRVLEQERLRAIAELDRLKQVVPKDKKAIDDLHEEARRAGVPPGWLR